MDILAEVLYQLKQEVIAQEKDTSRTIYPENGLSYKLGRNQGMIEGLDKAITILEGKIESFDQ